jgi:hypothetical protein
MIFWSQSQSQERVIDEYYNLNGKIKSISSDSYLANQASNGLEKVKKGWEDSFERDELIEFNENGKVNKVTYRGINSKVERIDKNEYSGDRLIKSFTKYQKVKHSYDEAGRRESTKGFDRTPNVITSLNIDETTDKVKFTVRYKYRDDNKLKQKTEYDSKGRITDITQYTYNSIGLLTKEESVSGDYKDWYVYQYDDSGKIINKKWFDSDEGLLENETNVFVDNQLDSSIWENYSEGELEGKITYKYENGNETEIVEFDIIDNTKTVWTYKYKYDSHNNWIEKEAHTYKNEYYITYREIEYY